MGGRVKNEGAKKSSKSIDIVSYASTVSVNSVIFIVQFRSSDTCVPGNNLVLHKALLSGITHFRINYIPLAQLILL